jgi:predicted enzyme related to lactoylglutathione lyase
MAQATMTLVNRPAWVDLASSDAEASRNFYGQLFGWSIEVNQDPQYGGYAIAQSAGQDAAGIGPKMDPNAPTAWNLYIGTDDINALASRVKSAGGTVVMDPFPVGDQGQMAVFQDPSGAFISAWQGTRMGGFKTSGANAYGWAEVNVQGRDRVLPFYQQVFGWEPEESPMGEGQPPYVQFKLEGDYVAGAWETTGMQPAGTPSYWQIYFTVDDVDASFRKALDLGAKEMLPPQEFPGGRFAIISDPQGAGIGLLKMEQR